jgi:aryl-alcohol dehydrogenase-like predicted oxidoreductase
METRPLGRTGLEITRIGFGAWAIGGKSYGPVEAETARDTLRSYLGRGGTFIDTARGYAASEGLIGEVLAAGPVNREEVVIASKSPQTSLDGLRKDLETSLRELRTDWIDLYYLHSPPEQPEALAEALGAMARLKEEGLIRAVGASVKGPNVTDATVELCRAYIRSGKCDALQVIYSILRQKNAAMFAEAAEAGVAIVARTLLENGFLTGKYKPGHQFAEGDHRDRWSSDKLDTILGEVERLSRELPAGLSQAQMAVRFVLDNPYVDAIIPGGKSPTQLNAVFEAAERPPLAEELHQQWRERYAGWETTVNPS